MKRLRRALLRLAAALVVAAGLFWAVAPGLPDEVFAEAYSRVVIDRDGEVLRAYLADDEQWRLPLSHEGLPDKLTQALLEFEDRRFYEHHGVDGGAVLRAAYGNATGRPRSGASTLTMQVARLAIPKERTLWSKLVEVKHALILESRYDKDEILRLWLGHAPYGGNLVGAEAAARRFYGCSPWELSWGQAAFLASLPKSPNMTLTVDGRAKLKLRRDRLLQRLEARGVVADSSTAIAEPIPSFAHALPFAAPHASDRLARATPGETVVRSTLDAELQSRAAEVVRAHAGLLRRKSVNNLAALIVHNPTGEVRAYLGSQRFGDERGRGQVDGVGAPRSSGSILKPFLYALAMERGLMVPQTRLPDVPTQFGAFTPANHDNRFSGELKMRDALIQSKNVPAVRVLAELGVRDFHALLEAAGFSTLFRAPDDYGLALILGGAEVNLWDLTAAYRGLALGGSFAPITMSARDEAPEAQRLFGPGVAESTLGVMRDLKRPGSAYYWRLFGHQRAIAWKTGTSYGHRDAWAVGVDDEWTVGVWAGNFDGVGRKDLWGSSGAAPVMFDLFALLPTPEADDGPALAHHEQVALCDHTGLRASADCPHTTLTQVPQNHIPLTTCASHRRYHVEAGEGVCSRCWSGTQRAEVRLVKAPEVNAWLRRHGQSPQEPPRHRSSCPSARAHRELALLQPSEGASLMIPRVSDGERGAIVMRAVHQRDDATLYWYLDSGYLGQTKSRHEWSTVLPPGDHVLRVVDDHGAFVSRGFTAKWSDQPRTRVATTGR